MQSESPRIEISITGTPNSGTTTVLAKIIHELQLCGINITYGLDYGMSDHKEIQALVQDTQRREEQLALIVKNKPVVTVKETPLMEMMGHLYDISQRRLDVNSQLVSLDLFDRKRPINRDFSHELATYPTLTNTCRKLALEKELEGVIQPEPMVSVCENIPSSDNTNPAMCRLGIAFHQTRQEIPDEVVLVTELRYGGRGR